MRMKWYLVLIGFACLVSAGLLATPVAAEPAQPSAADQSIDNNTCLACHAAPDQVTEFPSGEPLYITIDPDVFNASVHGEAGYACVQCHTDITGYPHPPLGATNRREVLRKPIREIAPSGGFGEDASVPGQGALREIRQPVLVHLKPQCHCRIGQFRSHRFQTPTQPRQHRCRDQGNHAGASGCAYRLHSHHPGLQSVPYRVSGAAAAQYTRIS